MKGQFMLISSILIGFIVISAATTISEVQNQRFDSDDISNTVEMIRSEASKVNHGDRIEIENFQEMVSMISGYRTTVTHWPINSCFNVTLRSPDKKVDLDCI